MQFSFSFFFCKFSFTKKMIFGRFFFCLQYHFCTACVKGLFYILIAEYPGSGSKSGKTEELSVTDMGDPGIPSVGASVGSMM